MGKGGCQASPTNAHIVLRPFLIPTEPPQQEFTLDDAIDTYEFAGPGALLEALPAPRHTPSVIALRVGAWACLAGTTPVVVAGPLRHFLLHHLMRLPELHWTPSTDHRHGLFM